MREGERAEDWLPESLGPGRRVGGDVRGGEADSTRWVAEERRLRAKRLSAELSNWVAELSDRSDALDSRLRDVEAAR